MDRHCAAALYQAMINPTFLQWVWLVNCFVTPIVLLCLGLKINKSLEKNRSALAKEKEWQTEWAKRFYLTAVEFNDAVEECVLIVFELAKISTEKLAGHEERFKKKAAMRFEMVERVQRAEWRLKVIVEFAPCSKDAVLAASQKVFSEVAEFLKDKQGNLDQIRESLVGFNRAAQMAHKELLQ